MKTNGLLIRRRRIALGHGMNRFAAIAGISGAALSRIENGQRDPRPETLKKITDALGCQIEDVAPLAKEAAAWTGSQFSTPQATTASRLHPRRHLSSNSTDLSRSKDSS